MLRVDIGSGRLARHGFTTFDIDPEAKPDIVGDLEHLPDYFGAGTVSEIVMSHVLEHVSWHYVEAVLSDMATILEQGGTAYVEVPDFEWLMTNRKSIEGDVETDFMFLSKWVYGEQDRVGEVHKSAFTEGTLSEMLVNVGLRIDEIVRPEHKEEQAVGIRCTKTL